MCLGYDTKTQKGVYVRVSVSITLTQVGRNVRQWNSSGTQARTPPENQSGASAAPK